MAIPLVGAFVCSASVLGMSDDMLRSYLFVQAKCHEKNAIPNQKLTIVDRQSAESLHIALPRFLDGRVPNIRLDWPQGVQCPVLLWSAGRQNM